MYRYCSTTSIIITKCGPQEKSDIFSSLGNSIHFAKNSKGFQIRSENGVISGGN